MHQISILTPTFNRAKYLPRIYDCLCQQKDIDFEWIIVDDGSSDNTRYIVSSFKNIFPIKYIYQENKGQTSARNTGTKTANSFIIAKLDDDDLICPDVLQTAWNYFDINSGLFENNCVCLSGLFQFDNGEIVGEKFHRDYYISDHIRYRQNRPVHGDKFEFYVTEVLRKYPFPEINGEKNISPHIVHERIARNHKTLYVNYVFGVKYFLQGGLSTQKYVYKYPHGSELYHNEASMPPIKLKLRVHHSSRYIFFAKMNKKQNIFFNAKNKCIYPIGLIRYHLILLKMCLEKYRFSRKIVNLFVKTKHEKRITTE